VEELEVGTAVHRPPEEVFAFLSDFPRYANYSEHLDSVESFGDGGVGTEYALTFSWWKVSYTVRSRVTGIVEPERIEFELERGLTAEGEWLVDPIDGGDGSYVQFVVRYDPDTVDGEGVSLPSFISLERVVDRVLPFVTEEAERVVERVVADLEGEHRPVDLEVSKRTTGEQEPR
jgi:carbon monoxide dehydrogenase subunit G